MSTVIVGCDPSSRAMHAVVSSDGKVHYVSARSLHKTDKPIAASEAFKWMHGLVKKHPLDDVFVFIEIPVMGRAGAHTMLVISGVVGGAAAGAVLAGAKVVYVNNQRWKKAVIGKGNCGKPEVKAWCKVAWPAVYEQADGNQDLMDAAAINQYGERVVKNSRKRPGKRVVKRKAR